MAKHVTVRSRTGPDGSLDIHVPTEVREAEVEVELVVRPVVPGDGRRAGAAGGPAGAEVRGGESGGWPAGFFESTYGALAGVDLTRHPYADYEARDDLR